MQRKCTDACDNGSEKISELISTYFCLGAQGQQSMTLLWGDLMSFACNKKRHSARDLRRRSSVLCSRDTLKNRDVNAALSIRNCGADLLEGRSKDVTFARGRKVDVETFCMHSFYSFFKHKKNDARNCMN